jgi:hypothetical protein
MAPQMSNSALKLKRFALPQFSGERRDWPEFRSVWLDLTQHAGVSSVTLAYELKRSLKGKALELVRNVIATRDNAYQEMWARLSEYYDDVTASVQSIMSELFGKLKVVKDEDFKGMVKLVDNVESAFVQLQQLSQTECLTVREIDKISECLPMLVRMSWVRLFYSLDSVRKLRPLDTFMEFLVRERAAVMRLADSTSTGHKKVIQTNQVQTKANVLTCVMPEHKENAKHKTDMCREFKKLSLDKKYEILKSNHTCFKCLGTLGRHRREKCPSNEKCTLCDKEGHHSLLCRKSESAETHCQSTSMSSHVSSNIALYAIFQTPVVGTKRSAQYATIFCDGGSNTTYITHDAAKRLKARVIRKCTLEVTTMGNLETTYESRQYELTLKTKSGGTVTVRAFGMDTITGPVSQLDEGCLTSLFPTFRVSQLQRKSTVVDVLLGADYFGLHPKHEIRSADNLSVMKGDLGICLQGSHPDLREKTVLDSNMAKVLHRVQTACHHVQLESSHPEFLKPSTEVHEAKACTFLTKTEEEKVAKFIEGEELATEVKPRCGGCKCSKCPTTGHTYSFKEEQELDMIRSNLKYDEQNQCWVTSYPWLIEPEQLPNNYQVALATLKSTENTLTKDAEWAKVYGDQILDMLERGVAVELSKGQLDKWKGPVFYLSHLAVRNPRSKTTPVRIVFNSSQPCQGVSLNSSLAK